MCSKTHTRCIHPEMLPKNLNRQAKVTEKVADCKDTSPKKLFFGSPWCDELELAEFSTY